MARRTATILIMLWGLVWGAAGAQESRAPADPGRATGASETRFELKGIMISSRSGRAALVNGVVAEEGSRVDGAEILAIGDHSVRLLVGGRELTVRVGGTAVTTSGWSAPATAQRSLAVADAVDDTAALQVASLAELDNGTEQRQVAPGETLSGIAAEYLDASVTIDQMMLALYRANPGAFGGNINLLYEGAILYIPDAHKRHEQTAQAASQEVMRQMEAWHDGQAQLPQLAAVAHDQEYGPVARGETLSEIAIRMSPAGITMNQMMMALYEANPQSFGGNINVLYEDAILRIPNGDALQRRSAEVATAEVLRQTQIWRTAHAPEPSSPVMASVAP